jgi:hypothetical protein
MLISPKNPETLISLLKERPLAVFGMGGMGQKIKEYCEKNSIPIACFVDNDAEKQRNGTAISPQKLKEDYPNSNVIISSPVYYHEIMKQLEQLCVDNILSYKIFLAEDITWADLDKHANWERMKVRARQLSEWLDEDIKSVIDYGAGEMYFETLLKPNVEYFPVDYIRRSEKTILCDLNSGDFPEIYTDAAVLAGLLDIISTAESFISHICKTTKKKVLASYMTTDKFPDHEGRRASAYMNNFTEREFVNLFEKNSFVLKEKAVSRAHDVDTLFLFERNLVNQ